jgi:hypothetical protein
MNKKSKKRASLVFVLMCLLYVSVTFRFPEKMSMRRISEEQTPPSKSMILPVSPMDITDRYNSPSQQRALSPSTASPASPEAGEAMMKPEAENQPAAMKEDQSAAAGRSGIEPSLLISVPVVCYAIKEGWIEKESLIFGKKDAYNNVIWKKPIEILKDHDEDGVRSILTTIGQKRIVEFVRKEGLSPAPELSADDIILGRGYRVDEAKLIAMYNKHVGTMCDELFPFSLGGIGIMKGKSGFEITRGKEGPRDDRKTVKAEWMMPNLANLPIRLAIGKLSAHTGKIKVYGNGHVMSQSPKAFERLQGEQECVIQGRVESE